MGDRVILHSDINCCYASIEHLHHPELAGKPLAVGGDPEARHGIVLTADYEAKKYGVKTGMALWQAKEVCPDITFVSPRMDLYLRFSRMAHEIYAEYTDRQEPYGIDECWLDVTGSSSLKGDGLLIAQEISRRMKSELGITVSVGVSFNKICTTWIEPPDYEQFIYELLNTPRETLNELRKAGYLLAVGSSSKNAGYILGKVDLTGYFDAVSDGNNITYSKPHPEVFEKAADFLEVEAEDCFVVEDAEAGIDAAKAAGMQAVGIGPAAGYEKTDISINRFGELLNLV